MTNSAASRDEFLLPITLGFVPTSCSIELSQDSDYSATSKIVMYLRPKSRNPHQYVQSITTTEGNSLDNVVWILDIWRGPTTSDRAKALGAMGLLLHFPPIAPGDGINGMEETCTASAYLETEQFTALQTFLMSGRLPSYVQICAQKGQALLAGRQPGAIYWVVEEGGNPSYLKEMAGIEALNLSLAINDVRSEEASMSTHQQVAANAGHGE